MYGGARKSEGGTLAPNRSLASDNKRLELRKWALKPGVLVQPDGATSCDCSILDISDSGARVRVPRNHTVPPKFMLIDIQGLMVHDVSVMWCNDQSAGVRFEASHAINSAMPDHLKFVRTFWIERATR